MTRPIRTCDKASAARRTSTPRTETVREYEERVEAEYREVRRQQWAQADAAGRDPLSIPLTAIFRAPRGQ
jgi:hypothetical protein